MKNFFRGQAHDSAAVAASDLSQSPHGGSLRVKAHTTTGKRSIGHGGSLFWRELLHLEPRPDEDKATNAGDSSSSGAGADNPDPAS
jgi:hypothetical protein